MRRVLVAILAVALAGCGTAEQEPDILELDATPLEAAAPPEPDPTPTPRPSPTASPSPTVPSSPTPRDPTDTDRARFARGYQPSESSDLEFVAADLDQDGIRELVFAYVDLEASVATVDVAAWDGTAYGIVATAAGGPARLLDRLRVGDVNRDGRIEIATFQTSREGSSLAIWQVPRSGLRLIPLRGQGGCVDGTHVYGAVGATLSDIDGDGAEEITATCNESPLPVSQWRSDEYYWVRGAYRVVEPEEPSPSPSESLPSGERPPPDEGDDEDDDD